MKVVWRLERRRDGCVCFLGNIYRNAITVKWTNSHLRLKNKTLFRFLRRKSTVVRTSIQISGTSICVVTSTPLFPLNVSLKSLLFISSKKGSLKTRKEKKLIYAVWANLARENKCLRKLAVGAKSLTSNWSLFTSPLFVANCNNIFHINFPHAKAKNRQKEKEKKKKHFQGCYFSGSVFFSGRYRHFSWEISFHHDFDKSLWC